MLYAWCVIVDITIVYKHPIVFLIHYGFWPCIVVLCVGGEK